jgi:hypothetical protein
MTASLLQLLQSVAKTCATDNALIMLAKLPAVALLQRFREVVSANFNLRPAAKLKLAVGSFGKPCNSATADDFPLTINALSVARVFATARNSCNRELDRCTRR